MDKRLHAILTTLEHWFRETYQERGLDREGLALWQRVEIELERDALQKEEHLREQVQSKAA